MQKENKMRQYIRLQVLYLVFPMRTKSHKKTKKRRKRKKELIFTGFILSAKQLETL